MTHIVIPYSAIPSAAEFLRQLVNPAARAVLLAGGVGSALAALRVKTTSTRLFTWKTVLCAALAMPLLGWMLPTIPVPAPSVLHFEAHPIATQSNPDGSYEFQFQPSAPVKGRTERTVSTFSQRTSVVRSNGGPVSAAGAVAPQKPSLSGIGSRISSTMNWASVAIAFYFAIALLLFARMAIGFRLARRVKRTAKEISDHHIAAHLACCARSFGLPSTPHCAESEVIAVPVTMGVVQPTILLPANWREWDEAKIGAVVAHEISHVARRDALAQYLSLLHRAIFWFSPLAWWLDRQLAELAEQASDEAALSYGADSNDYAKTLLGFFETLHAAPGRIWWQGVAMAKAGQAERRLERILAWNKEGAITMGLTKSAAVVIFMLAVPFVFLAASIHPASNRAVQAPMLAQKQTPSSPNSMPMPPTAPSVSAIPPTAPISASAPTEPVEPTEPLAPSVAWSGQSGRAGYSYAYDNDDEDRFVIVSGKTDSMTMSGSSQDARHVERLKRQIPGDFIWFQRDEKSYIIRDQPTIDRARSFWAPQEELGRKQEELGKQQEALGKKQEAIGHRMEEVKVNVPDISAQLDKLKSELKALGPTATQEQLGNIQSEIGELQSRIGEVQSQAGEQQSKIGDEMSVLGEQQGKLGEQQGELGRQQEKIANEAGRKMKELFDESIKNGKAQPEPQISQGGTI